jgi:ABC-2 type transport system permease protein
MSINRIYPPGTFTPRPGAAKRPRRILAQARFDLRSTLRNGEQLLLTLIIPLALLLALSLFDPFGGDSTVPGVDRATPGIIALAVMSTAFTSLAIATGFDRRSGALKLLGTTPLTRAELIWARAASVAVIEVLQIALIVAVALLLDWSPSGNPLAAVVLVVLGTLAFAAWGAFVAGILRAEATLAVANGIFVLLMLGGGVVVPASSLPSVWGSIVEVLPSGALAGGLRDVLIAGQPLPTSACIVLAVWAVVGFVLAARTFKWE